MNRPTTARLKSTSLFAVVRTTLPVIAGCATLALFSPTAAQAQTTKHTTTQIVHRPPYLGVSSTLHATVGESLILSANLNYNGQSLSGRQINFRLRVFRNQKYEYFGAGQATTDASGQAQTNVMISPEIVEGATQINAIVNFGGDKSPNKSGIIFMPCSRYIGVSLSKPLTKSPNDATGNGNTDASGSGATPDDPNAGTPETAPPSALGGNKTSGKQNLQNNKPATPSKTPPTTTTEDGQVTDDPNTDAGMATPMGGKGQGNKKSVDPLESRTPRYLCRQRPQELQTEP